MSKGENHALHRVDSPQSIEYEGVGKILDPNRTWIGQGY